MFIHVLIFFLIWLLFYNYISYQSAERHFSTFRGLCLSICSSSLTFQSLSSPVCFLLLLSAFSNQLSASLAAVCFCLLFSSCKLLSSYTICFVLLYYFLLLLFLFSMQFLHCAFFLLSSLICFLSPDSFPICFSASF